MSKVTEALERAVAAVMSERAAYGEGRPSPRQRSNIDRAFAQILKLIAPRIRHFIRQYGLIAHWDDAEQCCAIAVHRAIGAYDPAKAQFTTFINWQIRGELQALRFRLMADQRASARKVAATTVSLNALSTQLDGDEISLEALIEDEDALARTEAAAADHLAGNAAAALIDAYIADERRQAVEQLMRKPRAKRLPPEIRALPAQQRARTAVIPAAELTQLDERLSRDRAIIEQRLLELPGADAAEAEAGLTRERSRQITRRATRAMSALVQNDGRFGVMTH